MNIKLNQIKSVTLIEVIIALVALSTIALYITAIESIGRQDLLVANRRTKVQNEAVYLLEHITRKITGVIARGGAIGNTSIAAQAPVDITTGILGDRALLVWVDFNKNGQRDASDKQIAYRYRPAPDYEVWFYINYTDSPGSYEVITSKMIRPDFSTTTSQPTYVVYSSTLNYLDIQVTSCWDPDGVPDACGTSKNPQVAMHAYIKMPAVATH